MSPLIHLRKLRLYNNKITEIKINIPGGELIVKRETKTFEEGLNSAVDNLKRQLKRSKEGLEFLYFTISVKGIENYDHTSQSF